MYTKNGSELGVAFADISTVPLFPTIGMRTQGEIVRANFGQRPFRYDARAWIAREREAVRAKMVAGACPGRADALAAEAAGPNLTRLIMDYLVHSGYVETVRKLAGDAPSVARALEACETNGEVRFVRPPPPSIFLLCFLIFFLFCCGTQKLARLKSFCFFSFFLFFFLSPPPAPPLPDRRRRLRAAWPRLTRVARALPPCSRATSRAPCHSQNR
jgi:hypothetical protein